MKNVTENRNMFFRVVSVRLADSDVKHRNHSNKTALAFDSVSAKNCNRTLRHVVRSKPIMSTHKSKFGTTTSLRVARPSDDLEALLPFYRDGLGLSLSHRFENHSGFDGVILSVEAAPYHFEFTKSREHKVGKAPTEDNLLVFYLPDRAGWEAAVAQMIQAGFDPVPAFNRYWDLNGATFEDPDGYRVVLQCAAWDHKSILGEELPLASAY